MKIRLLILISVLILASAGASAQAAKTDEKAEGVLNRAVESLGGERYLQVKTLYATGKFSMIRDGVIISFQTFTDVIVYPNKERTDFKFNGVKNIQTNYGDEGWLFDGAAGVINLLNETQVKDFKRGLSVSLDNLLRRHWSGKGALSYIGKREATLGKRNDVIKLTYDDGLEVEFEFTAEGLPVKAIYKRTNPDGEEAKEEDRYAQFVETDGIKAPYIIDHFSNGAPTSRINYITIEFNKKVPDSIFVKPNTPKEAKKDLKL
jgi:outer membrane lipoprotein-sorting protein